MELCKDCATTLNPITRKRYGLRCQECFRAWRRKIRKACTYTKCSKCGGEMPPRHSKYCKPCFKAYMKERHIKKPKGWKGRIYQFVDRVISDQMYIDLYDMNTIITYFYYVSKSPNKYDMYPSGTQLNRMFTDLVKFTLKNRKEDIV